MRTCILCGKDFLKPSKIKHNMIIPTDPYTKKYNALINTSTEKKGICHECADEEAKAWAALSPKERADREETNMRHGLIVLNIILGFLILMFTQCGAAAP